MISYFGDDMLVYTFLTEKQKNFDIKIKLIDSDVVKIWRMVLYESLLRVPSTRWFTLSLASNNRYNSDHQIRVALSKLHNAFIFIQKRNLMDFNSEISQIESLLSYPELLEQSHLNRWHRYFTTLENKYSRRDENLPPNTIMDDLYEYIHDINEGVHVCEGYTYWKLPRRFHFKDPRQYAVQFTNANNHSYFNDKEGNHNVWDHCKSLFGYVYDSNTDPNNNDYTVWLNEDIVGKDQIKAWLDHDDLSQSDVTGNLVATPNVIFDPNKLYQRVLNDEEFRKESKLSGKTVDRFPLGNITNIEEIDWITFLSSKLIKITCDDNLLWRAPE